MYYIAAALICSIALFFISTTDRPSFGADAKPAPVTDKSQLDVKKLEAEMEAFKSKNGFYRQVFKGDEVLVNTVTEALPSKYPENVSINTYVSGKGTGYQIIIDTPTRFEAIGYGSDADEHTYAFDKPVIIATSSNERI